MNTSPSGASSRPWCWRSVVACGTCAAVFLAAVLLEACADDTPTSPGDPGTSVPAAAMGMNQDGTQIVIEPHWLTLDTIGVTGTLAATVLDAEGDTVQDAEVTWTSADTTIATVDTAGVVTSVEFGKTKVSATYDSATAQATVEVALPLTDREILEILYEATGGDDWTHNTNWLSDEELSEWYGVRTDGDGRVTYLRLYRNELTGAIPSEIGGLSQLDESYLNRNSVSGPIPAELGKLTRLRQLELTHNDFEGGLPPEMGGMKMLDYFDVAHNNSLGGAVPQTFARLELETFYSNATELCVPPSLRAWLDEISQTDNPTICTARITLDPPSLYFEALGDTTTLSATAVSAEGDTLHDATVIWTSADTTIATVDSTGLVTTIGYGTTEITATSDSLAGTAEVKIVFKLSDREVLEILYEATGGEDWTDTTNWLSDEPLSDWAGVETNEAENVTGLSLDGNNLTGSIPGELGELDDLATLDVSRNTLTGPVPAHLGALQQLRDLLLNGNALEGLLPNHLGYMAGLRYLHIGSNNFTGPVPPSFADLALDTLYAAGSGVCVPPSLDEWFTGIGQTDDADRCVASITIEIVDPPPLTFYAPGETGTLSATYVSAEGDTTHEASVTWSSGDTAVVSVDEAGTVTAVGDGETVVTATHDSTTASIAVEVALPENDRDVLEIFHDRARGDGWTDGTNWLSDEPLSEWAGVETDDSGRVVSLSLPGNNLRGSLHSSIGQLDQLVTLDLGRNWVSGSIPPEVGNLTRLGELALSVNGFSGELPSELGTLDSLRTLKVAATSLSGLVPASFADLDLESLLVNGTDLCLPPSLSEWLDSIAETDNPRECTSRVLVDPSSLTLGAAGDTARLSATVIGPEGDIVDDAEVTWASGDTSVARVDTTGLVTPRASGVTTITATYDSATSGSADAAVRLPGSDRAALEALYRATGGDEWNDNANWMGDEPLGEWYGVDTTANGRVRRLTLNKNNLTGRVPAIIGLLDSLVHLDLYRNALTGPIPPAIGRLRNLQTLFLDDNEDLSGPLPPQMGDMTGLRHLVLTQTGFSGPVPETFADLQLDKFFTDESGLCVPRSLAHWFEAIPRSSDPLPCIPETPDRDVLVTFYNATGGPDWKRNRNWLSNKNLNTWRGIVTDEEGYVTEISLLWDSLKGSIPPELGNLTRLEVLQMYGNDLTGRIPPELGKLTKVREFSLSANQLEGPIPPELGNLTSLELMILSDNKLSGPLPAELGKLAQLVELWLYRNELSGPLPPELGNLKRLKDLAISNNQLSGPLPPELGGLEALEILYAHTNQLEGPLPLELGKLSKLEVLDLARNQITGPLPPELGSLQALETLNLWINQVDGPIPPELGNLTSLEFLNLSRNRLSGSIPPELGNLSNLLHLGLYGNLLTGPIPPELGNLSSLVEFWLSENRLTGTIPAELGKLSTVKDFGVQSNNLSGPIPPELGRMSSLVELALHSNNLSGPLPPEIGDLGDLDDLRLQRNPNLEGLLPRSVLNLPLSHLEIGDTYLCAQLDDEFQEWLDGIEVAKGWECPTTQIERFALSELYASTGGDSWTNNDGWESDSEVGDWHGVTVGDSLVEQLRLPDNGLEGALPPEIGSLQALETLDLADNDLTGGVHAAIASIDPLDTIKISDNVDMEGPLPFRMIDLTDLKALQYADTDLCASPSGTFQDWIDELDIADGATCDNPDEVKLSLPVVYLNQAIQRPEGDVSLLSNRDALLRVFLVGDQEHAFFEPEVFATFTRDGEEVLRVVMPSEQDRIATRVDEGSLVKSYSAVIPAEHIVDGTELVVVADSAEVIPRAPGSQTRFPETGSAALDVIEVPPLELTVVPVLNAEKPDSSIFPWVDSIADLGEESPQVGLFKYSFPFSEFTAKTRETHVTSLDLTVQDNTWPMVLELEKVYQADGATGYWYAVADSDDGYVRGIARLNGWVSFGKTWDTELAHEVGHTLDLEHAPCGGPLFTDPDFPYDNGSIGMWGYDFRDSSLVSPRRRRDIMGYCYEKGWLSDYFFEKVIRVREEKEGEEAQARMAAKGPKGEMLVLWGGVLGDELRIEPVHSMYTTATLPEAVGAYRIEGIGRGGEVEFSLSFTPGEDEYGNKYFFFTIPIEADWEDSLERITLTGPEGEVTVDGNDSRSLTIVTDPATGRIRAILRDWNRPLPAALGNTAGLEVETTRGILEAVRLRR